MKRKMLRVKYYVLRITHHVSRLTFPMRIALNAQLLSLAATYRGAGISRYIHQLLRALPCVAPQHRYDVFTSERQFVPESFAMRMHYAPFSTVNPLTRIFWEQFIQPFQIIGRSYDLLHSMAFVSPLILPRRSVVTIYDLSFLRYPERFVPLKRLYLRLFTSLSARRAWRVIAISQSTKDDVVQLLGISPDRVAVVYCGVDDEFYPLPAEVVAQFKAARGLPERMVLYLGTIEPRKNLTMLVTAYAEYARHAPRDTKLVIAGGKGWYYDEVFARVGELGIADRVVFPGYVPQQELPLWYNAADLFVYPSIYEGFGLPPLEAMACGAPVITSNVSSLPEVVGDAGVTLDPQQAGAWTQAMRDVLESTELRADMRERGLARAARFSWNDAARRTVGVYEDLTPGPSPLCGEGR